MTLAEGRELVAKALKASDPSEVTAMLDRWLNEHGCGLMYLDTEIQQEASEESAPGEALEERSPPLQVK
jgi:hypothetical protein